MAGAHPLPVRYAPLDSTTLALQWQPGEAGSGPLSMTTVPSPPSGGKQEEGRHVTFRIHRALAVLRPAGALHACQGRRPALPLRPGQGGHHRRSRRSRHDGLLLPRTEDRRHPHAPVGACLRDRGSGQRTSPGLRQHRPGDDLPGRAPEGSGPAQGEVPRCLRRKQRDARRHPHPLRSGRLLPLRDVQPVGARLPGKDLQRHRRRHRPLHRAGPGQVAARPPVLRQRRAAQRQPQPLAAVAPEESGHRRLRGWRRLADERAQLRRRQRRAGRRDQLVPGAQHLDDQRQPSDLPGQQGLRLLSLGARRQPQGRFRRRLRPDQCRQPVAQPEPEARLQSLRQRVRQHPRDRSAPIRQGLRDRRPGPGGSARRTGFALPFRRLHPPADPPGVHRRPAAPVVHRGHRHQPGRR
ncbi:hypothetical protein PAERUG_P48_London_17_VIM_2_01_13_05751 [Pseudomonas aeruginosa]|nr:hypothetical protein PAERUG_P48_London_17_VIM_2_01_13_05751 [Pseudomonas aeruginosa]